MIGAAISHYRITDKLGEGGMGIVYKAQDTRLERTVALKFLASASMSDTERQRFVNEAQAAARIHHPNICPIFEISEYEGRLFFAMAFVEGQTISRMIEARPVPIDTALELAIQVANGLEAAHQHGIIHRDIKSGNIAVDRNGNAWILDFGVALRQNSERVTVAGGTVGTPAYMSPEQAQGLPLDYRTDLWSLGVVVYEMLTGQLPFRRASKFSVLSAIVNDEPPAVSPKEFEAFLGKALAKDPNQRWQSAAEMAEALRRIREGRSQSTQTLTSVRQVEKTNPFRWKFAAAVAALLLIASALVFWSMRMRLPSQKLIAVLPLQIIGDQKDETLRTLADGLVETLTAKLSQVEDFEGKVTVVPASEIRDQKITSMKVLRRIYNPNLVITGGVQRWGSQIQLTLALIDPSTVRQIRSRTLEFDADRPIAIRDRSVDSAVRLLALNLTPASSKALQAGETSIPGAYGDYLKGIGYLARYDVSGNVDRAIASLENAIEQDPKYALAYAALGAAHWRKAKQTSDKRQAELALASIETALRSDSRLNEARIMLGEIHSESGRPEEAITEEKNALRNSPGNARAYRALGAAYSSISNFPEAEKAYQNAVNSQPSDWFGYLKLGFFYVQRGRLSEARAAFNMAQKLTPDNEVVFSNLASLSMREGKFREASDLYAKTLAFDPGARTYAVLGIAYYYQGKFQEAASALNSSINQEPGAYQTWGNLGTVYRHIDGEAEEAREAFRKAIELATHTLEVRRGDFRTHANLGEYWAKLGDSKKALAEIEQIPESARGPFIDRIVLVYEFVGDRRRALDSARSIPPNSPVINFMRSDPDLQALWREMKADLQRRRILLVVRNIGSYGT